MATQVMRQVNFVMQKLPANTNAFIEKNREKKTHIICDTVIERKKQNNIEILQKNDGEVMPVCHV